MDYNPNIHHRRSIRLRGFDYSQSGLYFITICTKNRECLFGHIANGKMHLNDAGKIANECWDDIPNHFPNARLHEYVIMPNHIHGIIELVVGANNHRANDLTNNCENNGANDCVNHWANDDANNCVNHWANNDSNDCINHRANNDSPLRSPSKTIGSVVRGFKIGVTKWFRQNTDIEMVWQRNYYEHIVRDEQSYQRIATYIENNPDKWTDDKFYT